MRNAKNINTRAEKLLKVLNEISKMYGTDAIVRVGDNPIEMIDSISSGLVSLDDALGVGGFPKGRITEIFGQEGSGKTTIALMTIAEAQKVGGVACLVDAEHSFDAIYAKKLGVKIEKLLLVQPKHGEEALEIVEALVKSGGVDIIVVDSVAALTPKAEVEGLLGLEYIGLQAKMISQSIRKMTANIYREQVALIFINQLREKIGSLYGSSEVTPGGRALKFFSSIRVKVKTGGKISIKNKMIGNMITINVIKNKAGLPFKQIQLEMLQGNGISREADLLQLALNFGIIKKRESSYFYNGEKMGQGKEEVQKKMMGKVFDEIKEQVKSMMEVAEEVEQNLEFQLPLDVKIVGTSGM